MNPIISFGVSFVTAFQSIGAWLEAPMKFFSFLGSPDFFLIFIPLLYWSVDAALGIRVWFILLASTGLNLLSKLALHGPRPYWVSTDVCLMASETLFGVPSAHAELAAGFWGMVAAYYRKTWVWVAAVLLVLIIGLSRLYLGVHFPHDVLLGWLLGLLTLWAFVSFWDPLAARLQQLSLWSQIGLAFLVSLAILLLGALLIFLSRNFVLPADWIANASKGGNPTPNPFSMDDLITAAASLFGSCSALAWMTRRGGFAASGSLWQRLARYLLGLIGVLIFYAGLKAIFPSGEAFVPYLFRYIRYTILAFWVFGGAPWTFTRLNLTERHAADSVA
jgi:membrane-associated phospholipid phosphatase